MILHVLLTAAFGQSLPAIQLVDATGEPFRCASLQTVHHVRFQTDDDGWAAVDEPGLTGAPMWLVPSGPGVVAPVDWLGLAGVQVDIDLDETDTIVLDRDAPSPPCGRGDVEQRRIDHGRPLPSEQHAIVVVDALTQRPVPAVRVRIGDQELWTDNGGRVAFFDIDGMDTDETARAGTHGYRASGPVPVRTSPGMATVIELDRINLAERLVRLTGGGTWNHSLALGQSTPLAQPTLDSEVLGQDTVQTVPWRGGLFWLWGDTNRPRYPLGNFHVTGATTSLESTPEDGVDFDYFVGSDGWVRELAPRYASGPVWLGGLVALSDDELWAHFINVTSGFAILHDGMMRFDDATERFEEVLQWPSGHLARPAGPALLVEATSGPEVVYRGLQRVPATAAAMADPSAYASWSPYIDDGRGGWAIERDASGAPLWRWRDDAPVPTLEDVDAGTIPAEESPWHRAIDPDTGTEPRLHNGGLAWNPWRGRWIHIFTQNWGRSLIGEIWYAESDTPVGPWVWSKKVVTHDGYSFYNPVWHPWFASEGGRRVLFEGTYTAWLGTQDPTPRHDYNQFLYGLQLDDPELAVPVAFYDHGEGPAPAGEHQQALRQRFGAWDRPQAGGVPVAWTAPACASRTLSTAAHGEVAFWAKPAGSMGPDLVDLLPWTMPDGTLRYSVDDLSARGGIAGQPVATVWRPRWSSRVPLDQYPRPERADAGPDQCGQVSPVQLDGTASVLADGIDQFEWTWDGGSASGASPLVDLPPGLHVLTLTVHGPSGESSDRVAVSVRPSPCDCLTPATSVWRNLAVTLGLAAPAYTEAPCTSACVPRAFR